MGCRERLPVPRPEKQKTGYDKRQASLMESRCLYVAEVNAGRVQKFRPKSGA
jgi:hypothetical protein